MSSFMKDWFFFKGKVDCYNPKELQVKAYAIPEDCSNARTSTDGKPQKHDQRCQLSAKKQFVSRAVGGAVIHSRMFNRHDAPMNGTGRNRVPAVGSFLRVTLSFFLKI